MKAMKALLLVAATMLLCSCAEYGPSMRTSANFNGRSVPSMNLTDPKFYMDDDKPAPTDAMPSSSIPRLGIDGYCSANCRRTQGGGWLGY
jgi:hypothetical protein